MLDKLRIAKELEEKGLYDPRFEHDACGVGFIASIKGEKTHDIIEKGLQILVNLTHRGAAGSDPETGDGAGILTQIPHDFFKKVTTELGIKLPEAGEYAVGQLFLPQVPNQHLQCEGVVERIIAGEGQELLGWRLVPVNIEACGETARMSLPLIKQFIIKKKNLPDLLAFERKLYVIRRLIEKEIKNLTIKNPEAFYISSLSCRTIVYKGLLYARQISEFYKDLQDKSYTSAIALVHQRYSTNTFPTWDLAQPFRFIGHNGEINTLKGNINWMNSRESDLSTSLFGDDLAKILPSIIPTGSDSAIFDNVFELLALGGRSLAQSIMLMIPEAWDNDLIDENKKAFYEYHAAMLEPWDGPAAMAFTDGTQVGALLDRNGLRPARYTITKDGIVVLASEVGVIDFEPEQVLKKGRLMPGKIFLVDTKEKRVIEDEELKQMICSELDYKTLVKEDILNLNDFKTSQNVSDVLSDNMTTIIERQEAFGYTEEELEMVIASMANTAKEPVYSMGDDASLAVLSDREQSMFNYFKQLFAQVTNPPIDPIRERNVMSLITFLGKEGNLLNRDGLSRKSIKLLTPILSNTNLEKIRHLSNPDFQTITIPMTFDVQDKDNGLITALYHMCRRAAEAVNRGFNIIILSDRTMESFHAPIPSLLAVSALHQHLISERLRTKASIIVETGEAREVMHFALLTGYGATGINPYLAYDTIADLRAREQYITEGELSALINNYRTAVENGLLKIISKMGISTIQSYRGAQIFEAIGLKKSFVDRYFPGTVSRIGGVDIDVIAKDVISRHQKAFGDLEHKKTKLEIGGDFKYKKDGEKHSLNPIVITRLHRSTKETGTYDEYKEWSNLVHEEAKGIFLRGLFKFKTMKDPLPIDEVESAENIVKRFIGGAMSFGAISKEAHESLAIALNRLGGRSNSGEGGEDPARYKKDPNGDWRNSATKQVASGRFGVTTEYLVNCEEIQIKMAQGAKPGEGGQLPGFKVNGPIARVRFTVPGIELISPPPHHDIYSIEDLAQLIFDLKNVNPEAKINVKLVSEIGVGTVAAGVAKGHADVIMISGHDGGTGASPLSSIKRAGLPWELGIAETHQTLMMNDLRGRVTIQVDGQIKTGRDVVIAALLGAEEFGFGTSSLVVLGCVLVRKCHLNTCPVGVATQDPELRKKFKGKPDSLIKYLFFVAEEVREIMSWLGFRKVEDMIGRADKLEAEYLKDHYKSSTLDFSKVLHYLQLPSRIATRKIMEQNHGIEAVMDRQLIEDCEEAILGKKRIYKEYKIRNSNRTTGTMLSGHVAKRYGLKGLAEDTIHLKFFGSAGQSFGAWAVNGVTLELEGEANDYVAKGLSGGKIIIYPPKDSTFEPDKNIIAGNVILYGATGGEAYINGVVGERFAVRNSRAVAVVEGTGDHCCEYMTGGVVVILGTTGINFGAGMSGGIAYIYDEDGEFKKRINKGVTNIENLSDPNDIEELKGLIEKHFHYTASAKAKTILDQWDKSLKNFHKVIPEIYKDIISKLESESEKETKEEEMVNV